MKTLFLSRTIEEIAPWDTVLTEIDPTIEVVPYDETLDLSTIDSVIAWNPPEGIFPKLKNLKLIHSLGMGVDHLFKCNDLPHDVPIARLVDEDMLVQMADYILYGTLKAFRHLPQYNVAQQEKRWAAEEFTRNFREDFTVGILGLGELGGAAAELLLNNGFRVQSWSRSPKEHPQIHSYYGEDQLPPFLKSSDVLVCLLPLTSQTANLLNYERLSLLPKGAYLINPARGEHLVDEALTKLIDEGHLSGALLDVFREEPLPSDHPFWNYHEIEITPHIAAQTNPNTANDQIVENIQRMRRGEKILNLVNPKREY